MTEILDHPPFEEEGDDSEAGGGTTSDPVTEPDLEDARELKDEDVEDDE